MTVQRHSKVKPQYAAASDSDAKQCAPSEYESKSKQTPRCIYTYLMDDGQIFCVNNKKLYPVVPCKCVETNNYETCEGYKPARKFKTVDSLMKYVKARPEGGDHIFSKTVTDIANGD